MTAAPAIYAAPTRGRERCGNFAKPDQRARLSGQWVTVEWGSPGCDGAVVGGVNPLRFCAACLAGYVAARAVVEHEAAAPLSILPTHAPCGGSAFGLPTGDGMDLVCAVVRAFVPIGIDRAGGKVYGSADAAGCGRVFTLCSHGQRACPECAR